MQVNRLHLWVMPIYLTARSDVPCCAKRDAGETDTPQQVQQVAVQCRNADENDGQSFRIYMTAVGRGGWFSARPFTGLLAAA
jgi:hypothetical protein